MKEKVIRSATFITEGASFDTVTLNEYIQTINMKTAVEVIHTT